MASPSQVPVTLTTLTLPHLPDSSHNVHIAVFKNVRNVEYLRSQLLAGNGDFEYAFVDASTIISTRHILTAVFKALRGALGGPDDLKGGQLRTRNVHSEIVFSLSPNNNITESFTRFGITPATKHLIAIKIEILPPPPTALPAHPTILHNVEVVDGGVLVDTTTPTPTPSSSTTTSPSFTTPTTSLTHNQIQEFLTKNVEFDESLEFTDEALYSLADIALVRERYKFTPGKSGKAGKENNTGKKGGSGGGKKEKVDRKVRQAAAKAAEVLPTPTPIAPVAEVKEEVVVEEKKPWVESGREVQKKVESMVVGSIILKIVA